MNALGLRPRSVHSRPWAKFLSIWTSRSVNNIYKCNSRLCRMDRCTSLSPCSFNLVGGAWYQTWRYHAHPNSERLWLWQMTAVFVNPHFKCYRMQLTWLSCWTLWINLSLVFVVSRSTNLPDCFVSYTFLSISKRDCVDAFVFLFHVNLETLLTPVGSPLTTKHVVRSQVTAVLCQWSSAAYWWLVTFIHICGKSTQISGLVSLFQKRIYYSGEVGERHLA